MHVSVIVPHYNDLERLDICLTALGRQENWEDSPEGYPQAPPYKWWNLHDNYDAEASPNPKWVDIITDPQEAARKRETAAKA